MICQAQNQRNDAGTECPACTAKKSISILIQIDKGPVGLSRMSVRKSVYTEGKSLISSSLPEYAPAGRPVLGVAGLSPDKGLGEKMIYHFCFVGLPLASGLRVDQSDGGKEMRQNRGQGLVKSTPTCLFSVHEG